MAGMLPVPRSRGALSGTLLVLLGAWGALIPFVGPYFHYAYTPDTAWTYTSGRMWLEILPGAATLLAGLIVLMSRSRPAAAAGAWLAALSGAWFAAGSTLSRLWMTGGATETGTPVGTTATRVLEQIGFFAGLGVVIVFLGALALGRFTVVGVREAKRAQGSMEAAETENAPASTKTEERPGKHQDRRGPGKHQDRRRPGKHQDRRGPAGARIAGVSGEGGGGFLAGRLAATRSDCRARPRQPSDVPAPGVVTWAATGFPGAREPPGESDSGPRAGRPPISSDRGAARLAGLALATPHARRAGQRAGAASASRSVPAQAPFAQRPAGPGGTPWTGRPRQPARPGPPKSGPAGIPRDSTPRDSRAPAIAGRVLSRCLSRCARSRPATSARACR